MSVRGESGEGRGKRQREMGRRETEGTMVREERRGKGRKGF